ncbi:hypothetical protein SAMN05421594_0081 [Chryseobacterium oleae]|uniref:Uncharacterized protein n=1 Tax=Chryseobacterium oleae TaxID=491207 RepID=A0A1I4VAI3_CHROL|nr:hypothetical protein [Chryseobacterium oleae]SFM98205.1 hypothetical protein SAMN05421594_0081 [Chryseobacterium oleae]
MKKQCILLLFVPQIFLTQTGNIGINTATPTSTLDVNGNTRIRTIPNGNNDDSFLTTDQDGNVRKVDAPNLKFGPELALNGTTNMSSLTPSQVRDVYFVDFSHTITLPTMPNYKFAGKTIRFYVYGGSINLTVKGITDVPGLSAGASPGWTYSGTQVTITGANNRFQFIDFICNGERWCPDNK